jgi:DNA-binding transcriptional regulator YbjK
MLYVICFLLLGEPISGTAAILCPAVPAAGIEIHLYTMRSQMISRYAASIHQQTLTFLPNGMADGTEAQLNSNMDRQDHHVMSAQQLGILVHLDL